MSRDLPPPPLLPRSTTIETLSFPGVDDELVEKLSVIEDALGGEVNEIFKSLRSEAATKNHKYERLAAIKIDLDKFAESKSDEIRDILELNLGGTEYHIRRQTVKLFRQCHLSLLLSGRWDYLLPKDKDGQLFFDLDSEWIKPIFNYIKDASLTHDGDGLCDLPVVSEVNSLGYGLVCDCFGFGLANDLSIDTKISQLGECVDDLLGLVDVDVSRVALLYRGSKDGFRSSVFHAKCDGVSNTLSVIQDDKGNVFGGFADSPWSSSGNHIPSRKSFLFSLTNSNGQTKVTKHPLSPSYPSYALQGHPSYLCTFGNYSTISLMLHDNCNQNSNSCSQLGVTYTSGQSTISYLAGTNKFKVAELEVFQLTSVSPAGNAVINATCYNCHQQRLYCASCGTSPMIPLNTSKCPSCYQPWYCSSCNVPVTRRCHCGGGIIYCSNCGTYPDSDKDYLCLCKKIFSCNSCGKREVNAAAVVGSCCRQASCVSNNIGQLICSRSCGTYPTPSHSGPNCPSCINHQLTCDRCGQAGNCTPPSGQRKRAPSRVKTAALDIVVPETESKSASAQEEKGAIMAPRTERFESATQSFPALATHLEQLHKLQEYIAQFCELLTSVDAEYAREAIEFLQELLFVCNYTNITLPPTLLQKLESPSLDEIVTRIEEIARVIKASKQASSGGGMGNESSSSEDDIDDKVFSVNASGAIVVVRGKTLRMSPEGSFLRGIVSTKFKPDFDRKGNIYTEANPDAFRLVISYLRLKAINNEMPDEILTPREHKQSLERLLTFYLMDHVIVKVLP